MKKFIEEVLGFEVVEVKELERDLDTVETVFENEEISIEVLEDQETYYVTDAGKGYEFIGYYRVK